jgi:Effector Associated Constant Component 1
MGGHDEASEAEVWAGNPGDTDDLYNQLRGMPGITVRAVMTTGEPGEQGVALDLLTVALSSGAVTAFLQIIKTLVDSRGPKFELNMRKGKNQVKITADNFDAVEPLLRKLFSGR